MALDWFGAAETLLADVLASLPQYGGRSFVSLCPLEIDCCCDVIAVTPSTPALRIVTQSGAQPGGSVVQNPVSCGTFRYVANFVVSIGQNTLLCEQSPADATYTAEAEEVLTDIMNIHIALMDLWKAQSCATQRGLGDISIRCQGGCAVASFSVQVELS